MVNQGLPRARTLRRAAQISQSTGWEVPLFCVFSAFLAGAGGLFFLIYDLCQPTVYPNPGEVAYSAPQATRLIPLPRRSDAPEIADLPAEPPSALNALAQAQAGDPPAKHDIHPPSRKHPRADPRPYDPRRFEFTQQWNFGYRDGNNSRTWSGSPKSWF
jgi:hypothetical protein